MNKPKETAVNDFLELIRKSWSYGRMTEKERESMEEVFTSSLFEKAIAGTRKQRFAICHAVYFSYLEGIGYTGAGWRDDTKQTDRKAKTMEKYFVKRIDISKTNGTVLTTYNGRQDFCFTSPENLKYYTVIDYGFATIAAAKRTGHYKTWYTKDKSYFETKEIKLCKAVIADDYSVTLQEIEDE